MAADWSKILSELKDKEKKDKLPQEDKGSSFKFKPEKTKNPADLEQGKEDEVSARWGKLKQFVKK